MNGRRPGRTIIPAPRPLTRAVVMFFWSSDGDGQELLIGLGIGLLTGLLCGAVPLTVGLLKGNKSMAWTGFGVTVFLGAACFAVAILPALIFTIIIAVTEPIEKKKRKVKRRRRATADDLLEDDFGPKRRRDDNDEDRRRRRRRYEDDEDDDDDRPRRRRRREDDD